MDLADILRRKRPEILRIAERHGARNLRLFGASAAAMPTSRANTDLLMDLDPGRSLLDHAALVPELQELLDRKVDVATERGPRPTARQRVLQLSDITIA